MAIDDDIRQLVIARLETLPEGTGISVGSVGELSRDELLQHIENGDSIGKIFVEAEMSFLQALKDGILYESHAGHPAGL